MRTEVSDIVRQGLHSTWRTIRRSPGFALGVVVTLGLGIGANATMYGIVDRLLLQPPEHIDDADQVRLVFLERPSPITGKPSVSSTFTYPDYADLTGHSGLEAAAYTTVQEVTVGQGEDVSQARMALATASFFPLTGVQARFGRFYTDDEGRVGAPLTAVVSEEYWQGTWGGDPDVLGRTVYIQGVPATVVGVAPAGFTGVGLAPVDLWLPLEPAHAVQNGGTDCLDTRNCWWLRAVVRVRSDVGIEAAAAEATALHLNGRAETVESGRYSSDARLVLASVIAAEGPKESAETQVARWLAGVSAVVLLIACSNVANLLMARGTSRQRELGVRRALGATTRRIAALSLFESLALAAVGGLFALAIARWGGWFVRSWLLPGVYFPHEAWTGRLLAFTGIAALVAGLLAGLPPTLQSLRAGVAGTLKQGGRGASGRRSGLRGWLTVFQAALSVVLLVGAGLFVRSLSELRSLDLGLDVEQLTLIQLELEGDDADRLEVTAIYEEAQRILSGLPGVESTARTAVPFQWGFSMNLEVPGLDSLPRLPGGGPYYYAVSEGYFETVGVAVLRGRALDSSDGASTERVTVVSETMAEALWPGTDAIGACLMVGKGPEGCTRVVGVVEDAARGGYQDREFMAYYLPPAQIDAEPEALYVRTTNPASSEAASLAAALRGTLPRVRFANVQPLREFLDPEARSWTLGATMFSVFGFLALLLAAIGLYSVLAFDVAQRRRELGIRSALGATRERLVAAVLFEGGRLTGVGLILGLGIAWFMAPRAAHLLFEVPPRDPVVLFGVAGVLLAVSVLASMVPGLRATSVQPTEALSADQV